MVVVDIILNIKDFNVPKFNGSFSKAYHSFKFLVFKYTSIQRELIEIFLGKITGTGTISQVYFQTIRLKMPNLENKLATIFQKGNLSMSRFFSHL